MGTKIPWATDSWNPISGCDPISEGCKNCYARRMSHRLAGRFGYPESPHEFDVTLHPDRLELPLHWKKPRMVFVNSMGDLFHDDVKDEWIKTVFNAMATDILQPCWHTYLILTKRPQRMADFFVKNTTRGTLPWKNIWLGVTAENQVRADERIPVLLSIPAAVHFVSVEPMLDQMFLRGYLIHPGNKLDWVIAGPETGAGARPCNPAWIFDLWKQCHLACIPFFDKRDYVNLERRWPDAKADKVEGGK
ncbi:MAG: phage Gp37/Gp68 family protein [Patescibacteria group bacterium]